MKPWVWTPFFQNSTLERHRPAVLRTALPQHRAGEFFSTSLRTWQFLEWLSYGARKIQFSATSSGLGWSPGFDTCSQVALVVKNSPANTGNARGMGSIPSSGGSPGGGHGNPLQHSCLENPMDRGAWWITIYGSQRVKTTSD